MVKELSDSERIAVMETKIGYIEEGITRLEESIRKLTDNHMVHLSGQITEVANSDNKKYELLKDEVRAMKEFCGKVQIAKRHDLSGKDKALVYGSFITMIGLVIVQVLQSVF